MGNVSSLHPEWEHCQIFVSSQPYAITISITSIGERENEHDTCIVKDKK